MTASWRWHRLACVLLLCLAAAACVSADQPGGQDQTTGQPSGQGQAGGGGQDSEGGAGGAPGSPIGRGGGGEALESPVKVPDITNGQGQPLDSVMARLKREFEVACGGELCVTLRVVPREEENFDACDFVETQPGAGIEVARESEVVVVSGARRPCTSGIVEPTGETSVTDSTGVEPTDSTGAPQNTDPPPSTS
jgi:hypothetical protein